MQTMTTQRKLSVTLLVLLLLAANSSSAQTLYRVAVQQSVSVKMRHGVSLVADVYRPVSDEKFPVLLERTPYNRTDEAAMANQMASHGYIVVLQDTRGRFE